MPGIQVLGQASTTAVVACRDATGNAIEKLMVLNIRPGVATCAACHSIVHLMG